MGPGIDVGGGSVGEGEGVGEAVGLGDTVGVALGAGVIVIVGEDVSVGAGVIVIVGEDVSVGAGVSVALGAGVGVALGVGVTVAVGARVAVGLGGGLPCAGEAQATSAAARIQNGDKRRFGFDTKENNSGKRRARQSLRRGAVQFGDGDDEQLDLHRAIQRLFQAGVEEHGVVAAHVAAGP